MADQRKEYSEDDSFSTDKTSAEYGNTPHNQANDQTGNESFGEPGNKTFESNETTGSGLSELERDSQDGSSTNTDSEDAPHRGNEYLVDKYNINDKAHFDSSTDDFVKTTSNYNHADLDDKSDDKSDDGSQDSRH